MLHTVMSIARKIFSNTAWQILGKFIIAILGIISIKLITNYLSRSAYGEYTTIYDYTAIFAIMADFGLFTIAVREMAHTNQKQMIEKIIGNILALRTLLAVTALGIGIIIALLIPAYKGSSIPFGVAIVSGATIITLMAGTISSVLQFHLRMHWASIALTVGKFITVAYIAAVILYLFPNDPDAGFPHLLFAWIIGGLATILITYAASSRIIPVRPQFDLSFWKTVLVKALPYGFALILGTIYFRMGTIVLSIFKMKDQVGYYGVPIRFLEILQIIPHYFMNSVLPILTISWRTNAEKSAKILKYSLNALVAMAFPILAGGYMLAWPLTAAVSNPQFLTVKTADGFIWGSDLALKILLAAMALTYMHVAFSYALVAMGRQSELLFVNGIAVIINVALNLILVGRLGFIGAAISAVAAESVMFVLLLIKVRRRLKNFWDFGFLGKTILSSLIMGAVLFASMDYLNKILFAKSIFVLIPLGGIVFAAGLFFTKAVSKEMLLSLFKKAPAGESDLEIENPETPY